MGVPPHLGIWFVLHSIALLFAAASAVPLARQRAAYRPVAWFLAWVVLCQVVRFFVLALVLQPATDAGRLPFTGWERIVWHLGEQAFFVSWWAGLTALAIHAFTRWRVWPVAVAYLAAVAILILGYPTLRRELLQWAYLAITLSSLLVSFAALATWWRGNTRGEPLQLAVSMFLAVEVCAIVGPYAAGLIDVTWPIAQGMYVCLYVALGILEGVWLRRR